MPCNSLCRYFLGTVTLLCGVSATASGIQKCIIDGKTVYTDEGCGKGFTSKQVKMNHAGGIVSPDRQTIDDTLERARLQRWVEDQPGRSATRTTTRNGKTETHSYENPLPIKMPATEPNKRAACNSYAERIQSLDAMSRQPQSASTQDWIKSERARTISAMYDAKC